MSEHQYTVIETFKARDVRHGAGWLAENSRRLRSGQALGVELIIQAHMPYHADFIVDDKPFIFSLIISERSMGVTIFFENKNGEFVLRFPSRMDGEDIAGISALTLSYGVDLVYFVPVLSKSMSKSVECVRYYMRRSAVMQGFRDLGMNPDDPGLAAVLERVMNKKPPTPVSP